MSLPLMHMDIVGSTLSLTGQWVIYKKHWWGWALPICFIAMGISIRSAIVWRKS